MHDTELSIVTAQENNLPTLVQEASLPLLVDFWAPWCGPCQKLNPVLEKVAKKLAGKVQVIKVDFDSNKETMDRYQVRKIPTLLFFDVNKEVVHRTVGYMNVEQLLQVVKEKLSIT